MKIITAIGNDILNKRLKENDKFKILTEDLNCEDDVIKWFEKEEKINILIISENILKKYNKKEFFKKLREIQSHIQIILFNFSTNLNELQDEEYIKIYENFEINLKLLEEELIEKFYKEKKDGELKKAKIITITGCSGIGKSTFCSFFSQSIEKDNLKVLLIDLDIEENSIKTILKIKKFPKSFENIEKNTVKISKNLDVLCNLNMHYEDIENINYLSIKKLLEKFEEQYDIILIDTSSKIEKEYVKYIFYNSNEIYFLIEPNILGIKKSQKMLDVFEKDWEIKKEKIKVILNKANIYQISDDIMQELFCKNEIIGKIKYNDYYNLMINKNLYKKDIKKEYKKLMKNI